MAARVASHDWSATPLGPMRNWPQSLKTTVDLLLASGHAMQLAWGPERIVLYNDAYAPMLGDRHPAALGVPFKDAWPEIWDEIAPLVARVFAGETVKFEDMPLRMTRHGYPEDTWWTFSYSPVRDESGDVAGLLNVTMDVTARIRAQRAERERDEANARVHGNEERLRALVNASSDAVYTMSPDWTEMWKLDGRGFIADTTAPSIRWLEQYVFPEDRDAVVEAIQAAVASGRAFELEHRIRRADGSEGWTFSKAVPVLGEHGEIIEWFGMASDLSARREIEMQQGVLLAELQHRTRNLMGVIRAMSDMTMRTSSNLDEFRLQFNDRLDALSRVQGMLSRLGELERATFDELVQAEMAAIGSGAGRVTLDGPSGIRLKSSTLQTLALALHELATNAAKYGALSQSTGHLAIRWSFEQDGLDGKPWLHVDWRESGVAMPSSGAPPQGTGQGRRLIERALPYQLGAKTAFEMTTDGVHCSIAIPASTRSAETPLNEQEDGSGD